MRRTDAERTRPHRGPAVELGASASAVALALVLRLTGAAAAEQIVLLTLAAAVALQQATAIVRSLLARRVGVDVLALAAIIVTVAVGELWAAAVIVLMLTGGHALEAYAEGRAGSRVSALLRATPRVAHRLRADGTLEDLDVDDVRLGDPLLVRPGEAVPVDLLLGGPALLDESQITGESLPVERAAGERAPSGALVQVSPATGTAAALAADSEYQRITALVAGAAASRAPMVRLADRAAVPFTLLAFALAAAGWALSGDPVRFAEVLVVATPCPLLLAAPIAFVAGMGRAARLGVVVKHGSALETLGRIRTIAFDKTGTLTRGVPEVVAVHPAAGIPAADLLASVGAVELASAHPLAAAVVRAAPGPLPEARDVQETVAGGITGRVGPAAIVAGRPDYLATRGIPVPEQEGRTEVATSIHVGVDGRYAGRIVLADPVRSDAAAVIDRARALGVEHVLLLTGDARPAAEAVAAAVGIDDVRASCRPADKVAAVRAAPSRPVLMVGDGVNDAPVLAAADLGFAMGARGTPAAGEAPDVVELRDHLTGVVSALEVGRHTTRVARRAIGLGIGLSVLLMGLALTGALLPIAGALLQEGVDLATILAALAALGGRGERASQPEALGSSGPTRSPRGPFDPAARLPGARVSGS